MYGYRVPPTQHDFANAYDYGRQKAIKRICEKHPDKYRWVSSAPPPYTCPEPLECDFGTCEFTEQGCKAASELSYFDCTREGKPCKIASQGEGTCDICQFNIRSKFSNNFDVPEIPQDDGCTTDGCASCRPGDARYFYRTNPAEDSKLDENPASANALCKPVWDPEPYLVDGKPVACTEDLDCATAHGGAGGRCMLYGVPPNNEKRRASGFCVDPGMGYLEYRKGFTNFGTEPPTDQCVRTMAQYRKWCEMPWTRPDPHRDDDMSQTLENRIKQSPETKLHPPFYYDEASGNCYVTKEYCSNAVMHGGFETSFGKSHEALGGMFTGCTYPHGRKHSVREGYDCCTPGLQSFGQFFMGRTIMSDMRDVATGKLDYHEFLRKNPKAIASTVITGVLFAGLASLAPLAFLSDEALKEDKVLVYSNLAGPGIHGYVYRWSPRARQLYPEYTSDKLTFGILAQEVAAAYPSSVVADENGYCFIVIDHELYERDPSYRRVAHAAVLSDQMQNPERSGAQRSS